MEASPRLTLLARYLFPVKSEPIAAGWIRIEHGKIDALGRGRPPERAVDLGNVAIVPGFVNAHTHLELGPLPEDRAGAERSEPEDQIAWLRRMIEWRRGSTPEAMRRHAQANVDASIRLGTTALADITTRGTSWDAIIASPLRGTVYSEVLGLSRGRGLETTEAAFEWLAKVRPTISETDPRLRAGLSPHAPYSTAGWIYQRAAAAHLPLSTHLAELREEVELLALRDGRLRDFFRELGVWDEEWQPLGDRPADYIRKGELRQADWIVAHGNHLEPSDYWQFRPSGAPSGQRVAVAYCPRTHHRFGHATHPYRSMLERDIVVCIGTDSRATAASLSVLDELRFLHRIDPDLRLPLLMAMGTLYGAWGLRLDNVCGSLAPGKAADLAVIPLPDRDESDPHRLIFEHDAPVSSVYIGGELAARGTTPLPLE